MLSCNLEFLTVKATTFMDIMCDPDKLLFHPIFIPPNNRFQKSQTKTYQQKFQVSFDLKRDKLINKFLFIVIIFFMLQISVVVKIIWRKQKSPCDVV